MSDYNPALCRACDPVATGPHFASEHQLDNRDADRTDADIARDEQAREHEHGIAAEQAQAAEDQARDAETVVTTEKAQAVLAVVVARYWRFFEPVTDSNDKVIAYPFDKPYIRRDERGHAIVVWDDGPDDWAYQASEGGSTETERVLIAKASVEFGGNLKAGEPEPVKFPADVNVEVYDSKSLGIYPA